MGRKYSAKLICQVAGLSGLLLMAGAPAVQAGGQEAPFGDQVSASICS